MRVRDSSGTASGYGGAARPGWSLDCADTRSPFVRIFFLPPPSLSFCKLKQQQAAFLSQPKLSRRRTPPPSLLFSSRPTDSDFAPRMQRKEASLCAGCCWRLTLLSCVLALHFIPQPVHGKTVSSQPPPPPPSPPLFPPPASLHYDTVHLNACSPQNVHNFLLLHRQKCCVLCVDSRTPVGVGAIESRERRSVSLGL